MDFYFGGYFIIESTHPKEWMGNNQFPNLIKTPSHCICNLHPDSICLNWVKSEKNEITDYQNKLKLSDMDFDNFRMDCDKYFNEDLFAWQSVFTDYKAAEYFLYKYLQAVPNLDIFSIATTADFREKYLKEEEKIGTLENMVPSGIYLSLKKNELVNIKEGFIGFDILGFEYGSCHSFICNSLEKEYSDKLGIKLNENGLIESFEDACKATEFTNLPETAAEPVLWIPWSISKIDKNTLVS